MSDANHIAILDDDPEIRSLLEQNLRSSGFEVSTASTGRDLKTILEHQTIDLVVLDLMLPGEDGLTICRELRADSNIPIIMLTAMTHEADRIIGLEMGADDYLTKPFSPRELVARIKATLRRQGMITSQSEDRKRVASFEGCVGPSEGPRVSHSNFLERFRHHFCVHQPKKKRRNNPFWRLFGAKKSAKMAPKMVVLAGVLDILAGRFVIWA